MFLRAYPNSSVRDLWTDLRDDLIVEYNPYKHIIPRELWDRMAFRKHSEHKACPHCLLKMDVYRTYKKYDLYNYRRIQVLDYY